MVTLTPKDIKTLESMGRQVRIPAGWAPMSEKTAADKLYLVLSGEASVRRDGQEIARLKAGDFMGEMAWEHRTLRTATVVALTPMTVIHFTRTAWAQVQQKMPAVAKAVSSEAEERKMFNTEATGA